MSEALLRVRGLDVSYAVQQRGRNVRLRALRGVSFELLPGEALAVIGESGSGKSTLARALLRLIDVDAGEIVFRGQDLLGLRGEALRRMRAHLQMIFQDGLSALDPRMQISAILGEPLRVFRPELTHIERDAAAGAMLERVGLTRAQLGRYPHEFSGGQRQRISIARAMLKNPPLLLLDLEHQHEQLMRELLRRLVALLEAVADHALHDPVQCYRIIGLYYFCGVCCH